MNILAFTAHPDDETILAGGTLALLARAGADVHYLCATRGEGGELGEPPLCTRSELGRVREDEMRCAVQALGGKSVSFLDYSDPLVGEHDALYPYTNDLAELTGRVIEHIQSQNPLAVITHGSSGEYGHPAHVLTNRAALKVVETLGNDAPLLYTFNASFPGHPRPRHINRDDPAHLIIDINPVFQQKIAAALCHSTQNALFVRRSSKRAGRDLSIPEILVKVEGLHRHYPEVNGKPNDHVAEMLDRWVIKKDNRTK